MNVLCVGGPVDGRRVVLSDTSTRYNVVEHERTTVIPEPVSEPVSYRMHGYNLFRLHPVTQAVIFAHEDLTPTQIMERLMEYYPSEKDKTE